MARSKENFQIWLNEISTRFVLLTPPERVQTLMHLLTKCDTTEKFAWQQQLSDYLFRDIIVWLPPEISSKILSYLDGRSLLNASLVSKGWHQTVVKDQRVWSLVEQQVGTSFKYQDRYVSFVRLFSIIFIVPSAAIQIAKYISDSCQGMR